MIADLIALAMLLLLGLGLGYSPFPAALPGWLRGLARSRLFPLMILIMLGMLLGWASYYHQYGLEGLSQPESRATKTLEP